MSENNKILLSIIIPVYNGEKYITEAIKSITIEEYPMCELIIIDDASKDSTETKCIEWRQLKNVVYIRLNDNHGVAYARNYGIKISKGEFITFLDCDDILLGNAIEIYLNAILKYDADLIISGYALAKHREKLYNLNKTILMNKSEFLKSMFLYDILKKVRYGVLWGKVYKRTKIYEKNKIYFNQRVLIGEDTWFNIDYYERLSNVLFIPDITYKHIVQNDYSLTNQYEKKYFCILIYTSKKYKKLFSSVGQNGINLFTVHKLIQLFWRTILYYIKFWLKS